MMGVAAIASAACRPRRRRLVAGVGSLLPRPAGRLPSRRHRSPQCAGRAGDSHGGLRHADRPWRALGVPRRLFVGADAGDRAGDAAARGRHRSFHRAALGGYRQGRTRGRRLCRDARRVARRPLCRKRIAGRRLGLRLAFLRLYDPRGDRRVWARRACLVQRLACGQERPLRGARDSRHDRCGGVRARHARLPRRPLRLPLAGTEGHLARHGDRGATVPGLRRARARRSFRIADAAAGGTRRSRSPPLARRGRETRRLAPSVSADGGDAQHTRSTRFPSRRHRYRSSAHGFRTAAAGSRAPRIP